MRSSKSRSRNKNNRNRNSLGNVVNRVFDSNGPEGKVRGTPQQIIDKYNQLARDAALSNDRVAAENFQQHAEHYMRLLSEAQKEQDARREQQERDNRERQAQRDRDRAQRDAQQPDVGGQPNDAAPVEVAEQLAIDPSQAPQPDVIEPVEDTRLVETPEAKAEEKPKKPRAPRKPRAPKAEDEAEDKPKRPRAPRKPRAPKSEEAPSELPLEQPGQDAAE